MRFPPAAGGLEYSLERAGDWGWRATNQVAFSCIPQQHRAVCICGLCETIASSPGRGSDCVVRSSRRPHPGLAGAAGRSLGLGGGAAAKQAGAAVGPPPAASHRPGCLRSGWRPPPANPPHQSPRTGGQPAPPWPRANSKSKIAVLINFLPSPVQGTEDAQSVEV